MTHYNNTSTDTIFDVVVVGGGVVGLSILRSATLQGWRCALVEAESDLLYWASGSNSGIACTGVDASPGSLERALIRDSISQIRGFCKDHNIPTRPCGSLVCRWSWDQTTDNEGDEHKLEEILQESHDAGDTNACILSSDQVKQLEPNLSDACLGAVHLPGEIVVDPWLFSIAYAVHARENGAKIYTDWSFDANASSFDGNVWTAVRAKNDSSSDGKPAYLRAKVIVNAAGLWSDKIQEKIHQTVHSSSLTQSVESRQSWTAKPRRGQYRIFKTSRSTRIEHPIQPVPTQRTKGIFVFSTLYGSHIVVGPTALDVDSRTDRSVDPAVAKELARHAKKIIPALDTESAHVGDYVGIRPGTDKRDYQIHISRNLNWVAAAGIRSTGLTASLGIGNHVVHLLTSFLTGPASPPRIQTTPLPFLPALIKEYRQRGDGSVCIQGHSYMVTHPLTKFGWDATTGVAHPNSPLMAVYTNYSKL